MSIDAQQTILRMLRFSAKGASSAISTRPGPSGFGVMISLLFRSTELMDRQWRVSTSVSHRVVR